MSNILLNHNHISNNINNIRLLLCDVDGVMSDGGIYLGNGYELKRFCVRDGLGIKVAQENGLEVGIITGLVSEAVTRRARNLDITEVHQGISDKMGLALKLSKKRDIPLKDIAYIGDDYNDLELLLHVGLSCTIPSAPEPIKKQCNLITIKEGGYGAVRELIEYILKMQNKWPFPE